MDTSNSTNYSDLCEFFTATPFSTWLAALQVTFLVLSLLASLFLNASFTIVVIIHKALHQKGEVINLVLTVSNICYSVVRFVFETMISGGWTFGRPFCYAAGATEFFFALLRMTFILAITVDRFGEVMLPFKYPRHSVKVAAVIFAVGSVYSVGTSLVLAVNAFGCYDHHQDGGKCTFPRCLCSAYNILQAFTIILLGVIVPLILNVVMFYKAKKLRNTVVVTCGTIGNVTTGYSAEDRRSQDIRAMVTIALLLSSVVGLALPRIALVTAKGARRIDVTTSSPLALFDILLSDLYALLPSSDALVVWRNREVKERTKSLYKRVCKIFKPFTVD